MLVDKVLEKKIKQTDYAIKDKSNRQPKWISIAKSISWRIVGTIDTMVISYIVTGEVTMALSIGSFEVFSKMALYYFHERAWEKFTK